MALGNKSQVFLFLSAAVWQTDLDWGAWSDSEREPVQTSNLNGVPQYNTGCKLEKR